MLSRTIAARHHCSPGILAILALIRRGGGCVWNSCLWKVMRGGSPLNAVLKGPVTKCCVQHIRGRMPSMS